MHVPDEAIVGPGESVAIIGAALRFPGASDPSSFHDITVAGRRMFRELAQRTDSGGPPGHGKQGKPRPSRPSRLAALLDEAPRLGRDDALTGGITARHVLAAETAAAALADIPAAGRAVAAGRIGVFIADIPEPGTVDVRDWVRRHLGTLADGDATAPRVGGRDVQVSGTGAPRPAGAILHDLLLGTIGAVRANHGSTSGHGTAVVDGPLHCSLRAVTAACEALNSGQFDLVLAGGVAKGVDNWMHGPATSATARDRVRVYDARPTGSLPGEGCGIVALTRAADAHASGVPAYAEIAGWHYADPATPQRAVLPAAYRRAGIDPADIQFVEGHGAATAADDLAELTALLEVLGPHGDAVRRCALGSVSAIFGDTRAAAGVAALLKTAFAMTADVIPPSTGCVRPNPLLRGAAAPFRLPAAPEQWPQTPVQLAAVNTLGTAAHPDEPRSGPVHVVLRRERDLTRRPGRRRKPCLLPTVPLALEARP
ncbi:MAG: polyketide synthase [Trebonia sp.]